MRSLRNLAWSAYLLGLAGGSLYVADSSWRSVTQYRSTYAFESKLEAGPAIASAVVLVVLDGLRTDAAARLPVYGRLARAGASGTLRVTVPSLSYPARAALGTGAWPEVSGVTNNSTFGPVPVQSLFGLAEQRGLRSAAFGLDFWSRAFGSSVVQHEPAEGYSSYAVRDLVRWQGEYCDEAVAFLTDSDAAIRIVDLLAGDEAGHAYGGASDPYREVVAAVDGCLGRIVDQVGADVADVTVVAVSDHGQIHRRGRGGHGGLEPEVINAPFALTGPGIRTANRIKAELVDIAPTISTLLGLPIPANSQGRVLWAALDVPPAHDAVLRQLEQEQQVALQQHMPDRKQAVAAQRSQRWPAAILIQCCLWAGIAGVGYRHRQDLGVLATAIVCFIVVYFALFSAFGLGYSLSSIVRQEYLNAFLAKDVAAAAVAYGSAAVALFSLAGRRLELAIGLAVWICSLAGSLVVRVYATHGLRMDGWMLEIGSAFQAYLHMVGIVGVVLATGLVAVINRLVPVRGEAVR